MPSGIATVDFGAFPGKSDASLAVTGQALILSTSLVEAWIRPVATSDHSADEHLVETLTVLAGNIVAGTGFTIYAVNIDEIADRTDPLSPNWDKIPMIYGQWTVAWAWSN